ncbi:hypothetical protein Tco_0012932 [Tanacetum coccineum]
MRLGTRLMNMNLKKWTVKWQVAIDLNEELKKYYQEDYSDTEVISCSNKCKESYVNLKKLYDAQREQLSDASIEIKAYSQGLKKVEAQLVAHQQGQLWFVTADGMHVVPSPMTGNYMPSGPEIEVDYSKFTYGPKQTQPSESESQTSEFDTCKSNISAEPSELVSELVVNESNIECQPKVWSDAPIIEEYESDSEDEYVSTPRKEQETPSFANQQVKTPRETIKNQFTHSQKPKVDKTELGYGFTVRACFVCGSLNHLIRDCDFHEKRMARKAELNNGWNNVQRVNKQNQFVPSAVLTRTGKIPVSTARASSTKNFSTARQSVNRQTALTSTAMKVNTVKPIVNRVRPANLVLLGEKGKLLLSPQQVVIGDHKDTTGTMSPNTMVDPILEIDYPHRALKNKGNCYSGCPGTDWKQAYLATNFKTLMVALLLLEVVKVISLVKMSSMGELTFFLGLQVKQKANGIFINQDKYVAEILKKFDLQMLRLLVLEWLFNVAKGQTRTVVFGILNSSFDTDSYSDSDYLEQNLGQRISTIWKVFQCLGRRLSFFGRCKKQNALCGYFYTEAEHNIQHNLEKSEGNGRDFTRSLIFLSRIHSSCSYCKSAVVSTTFVVILDVAKVNISQGKSPLYLLLCWYNQLIEGAEVLMGCPSERPSEAQPTPSPAHTSEVPFEPHTDSSPAHTSEIPIEQKNDPSPRPSPSTIILDSIPETSGGNLGGISRKNPFQGMRVN